MPRFRPVVGALIRASHANLLSAETVSAVKATAPRIAAAAPVVSANFFKKLLSHPDLAPYKASRYNDEEKASALANAVNGISDSVDNLRSLSHAITTISHRHVALSVEPDLYPIAHESFLEAIAEELGDEATPEMKEAWSDALMVLADVCIDAEEGLARTFEGRQGGWRGEREFVVTGCRTVAEETKTFTLAPTSGEGGFAFAPGQHLSLRVPSLEAGAQQYVVTSTPGSEEFEITTRLSNGVLDSHMHGGMEEGDSCLLGVPAGTYTPSSNPDQSVVLAGAGIGAAPLLSFLNYLDPANVKGVWLSNKSPARTPFKSNFESAGATMHYTEGEGGQRANLTAVASELSEQGGPHADYYLSGPPTFMTGLAVELGELGVSEDNIHTEVWDAGVITPFAA